jgi:hypothetical protein
LDYFQRLFHSRFGDLEAMIFTQMRRPADVTDDLETIPYHLFPELGLHKRTGEVPVAIHLAGESAQLNNHPWWGYFWWTKSEQRFRKIVRARADKAMLMMVHNNTKVAYRDVCPDSILGQSRQLRIYSGSKHLIQDSFLHKICLNKRRIGPGCRCAFPIVSSLGSIACFQM